MENNEPTFYNKDKSLSQYSFMCGYQEHIDINNISITLEPDSACYHVRAYDFNEHLRLRWDSYESLTTARKEFYKEVKRHTGLSKKQYLQRVSTLENRV